MARVLFTSCPAYGHVLPMLPLIRAAERADHDVRVATGPDLLGALAGRGLDVRSVGPTFADSWAAHESAWADPHRSFEEKMLDGVVALFGHPALARLADLMEMTREWRPDVVVHEVLELAGSILAHRLDVSGIVHGLGPMFPFYTEFIGPAGAVIGVPELWAQVSSERALDICPPSLQPDDGPLPWPHATPLRPTVGEPGPVPARVAEILTSADRIAYFTLGTVKNNETADFMTGLSALEEYDGLVIATTGPQIGPEQLGPVPANATVEAFVPQAEVLPRTDLLVSHSGSGTMLGGLVHGVPQVALPRGTDQPQNAALMARAGAGVVVAPEDYAAPAIRAAVNQVAGDPQFQVAAERVRDEIAAMPDADTVWESIGV